MSHSQFGSNKKVSDIFNKMIKLSGLNIETRELKEKTEQDLERALSIQTMFISHLYEEDGEVGQVDMKKSNKSFEGGGDKDNDTQFRLIACDHIAPKPLGLRQLLKDVENVDKRVDAEKGELGGFTLEDLKVKQM
ncbi:GTF1 [Candida oxycetoniae]|uniref:GTF1 n=1 Tax=Candida oxycetoniae TaxID=497107 RepID=A0AAI9WXJ5_9ASCO|nr:GTF1 [Candida oxycetoniae]KAI3404138.2 GTF1 [Candida oxycetoniae]